METSVGTTRVLGLGGAKIGIGCFQTVSGPKPILVSA